MWGYPSRSKSASAPFSNRYRYNLAITEEEKASLSEAVRLLHGIDKAFWYRNRPEVLVAVQRLHRDGHPDPKVVACTTPRLKG